MRLSQLIEMLTRFRRGWAHDPEVVVEVDGKLYPVTGYQFMTQEDDAAVAATTPGKVVIQTQTPF